MSKMYSSFLVVLLWAVAFAAENDTCGSLYVTVDVLSPAEYAATKVSASTKFGPLKYSVSETLLMTPDLSDDLCGNITAFDVFENNLILIEVDESSCSAQSQVLTAEALGALGVVFYNSQDGDEVYQLSMDELEETPTIPARMISQDDGFELLTALAHGNVSIAFNCEDESYAQTVCVYDSDGDHWYLDGNYELQSELEVNGHPVWQKSGYAQVYSSRYIWLETNASEWIWVLSNDTEQDTSIASRRDEAYCTVAADMNATDPSVCDAWDVLEYENGQVTQTKSGDLVVNGAICDISDNYYCIRSAKSQFSRYEGTFHQIHSDVSVWVRELDNVFDDEFSHILIDSYELCSGGTGPSDPEVCTSYATSYIIYDEEQDVTAVCPFNGTVALDACETWYLVSVQRHNGRTLNSLDTTFDVDPGWCVGYLDTPNTTLNLQHYPEEMCLQNTPSIEDGTAVYTYGGMQYLYGTWSRTDVTNGGAPVWKSLRMSNTSYATYLFLDDQDDLWVMAREIPEAEDAIVNELEGECATKDASSPLECSDCWEVDGLQSCMTWNLTDGTCEEEEVVESSEYLPYICLTFQAARGGARYSPEASGLYALQSDTVYGRYYYKYEDESSDSTFYVYYFKSLRYWVWAESILDYDDFDDVRSLYCVEYNNYDLVSCDWTGRGSEDDWQVHECVNGTYEEYDEQTPTRSPNTPPAPRPTEDDDTSDGTGSSGSGSSNSSDSDGTIVVVIVTCIIAVIILVVAGGMYLRRRKKGHGGFGSGLDDDDVEDVPMTQVEDHATLGGQTETGGVIGMEDEDGPDDDSTGS